MGACDEAQQQYEMLLAEFIAETGREPDARAGWHLLMINGDTLWTVLPFFHGWH